MPEDPDATPSSTTDPTPPSPRSRRRPRRRTVLVFAGVVVLLAAVYAGLSSSRPDQTGGVSHPPRPTPTPTPIDSLDLSGLPIERGLLCDRIEDRDVEQALRGPATSVDQYRSGDRTTLAAGLRDVSHEYGCRYRADDGAQARVWVFAEPVGRAVAAGIVRGTKQQRGCRVLSGGPTFGTPSVATSCPTTGPKGTAVSLRGLFGDAWLTCQLATPSAATVGEPARETVRRTQRWCVDVATRAGARP